MPPDLLSRASRLAERGNRAGARDLLIQAIKQDPGNAQAWFMLSLTTDDPDKIAEYLHRVIELNPDDELARRRLQTLEQPRRSTGGPSDRQILIGGIILVLAMAVVVLLIYWLSGGN
jgi:tetratricopeptide (TPR) repeat protein